MNAFGLVHSGGFGALCWDSLLPELTQRGHRAATVDLSPDDMASGAARCAEVVHQAFIEIPDLVLVGHSIAGLIIPLVAVCRPVRRLVFLHALLPRPGQSIVGQMKSEPDMFDPEMFTAPAPFWEMKAWRPGSCFTIVRPKSCVARSLAFDQSLACWVGK